MLSLLFAQAEPGFDWTGVGTTGIIIGSAVGLIVWLVKESFKRQAKITDRHLDYLERREVAQNNLYQSFSASLDATSKAMIEQTNFVKASHEEVVAARRDIDDLKRGNGCRYAGGKP